MNEAIKYHTELFNETIENFEKMLNAGQIDQNEYNQYLTAAYVELQERIAEELGIDEADVEEFVGANYSDESDYAEFSVGNRFGAALVEIGEELGYEDLEEYCIDLAKRTNNTAEDIFGLITGENVPDNELALELSEIFELDEDYQADLLIAGIEARGEDISEYLEDEEVNDDDNEDEDEDEDEDVDYSRVNQLESKIAEFEYNSAIKDNLIEISEKAYHLVESGQMPPIAAEILIGSFSSDKDRIAAFSTVCVRNSVSAEAELHAMRKTLEIFERMPAIEFGYYAQQEINDEEFEEENDLATIAANYVKNLRMN